ncbi:low affinity iron permease family protein [Ensifer adhaerens]|uniref:low affinity iron permease family protein n=1 Tax=Ensifer adhaerens TaxID=106592 RepID=UPI0039C16296
MDRFFARFATATAHATGSPLAFIFCVITVLAWALSGPFFGFSETWQLVINTGTTIVTFLMVFLIQNTQNRDGAALQANRRNHIVYGCRKRIRRYRETDGQGATCSMREGLPSARMRCFRAPMPNEMQEKIGRNLPLIETI